MTQDNRRDQANPLREINNLDSMTTVQRLYYRRNIDKQVLHLSLLEMAWNEIFFQECVLK